jgi:hypothetical protein
VTNTINASSHLVNKSTLVKEEKHMQERLWSIVEFDDTGKRRERTHSVYGVLPEKYTSLEFVTAKDFHGYQVLRFGARQAKQRSKPKNNIKMSLSYILNPTNKSVFDVEDIFTCK